MLEGQSTLNSVLGFFERIFFCVTPQDQKQNCRFQLLHHLLIQTTVSRFLKCCPMPLKALLSAQLFIICLFAYLTCVKTVFECQKDSRCFPNPLNSMHRILLLLWCQWPGTESKPVWGKLFSFYFNSLIRYVEF